MSKHEDDAQLIEMAMRELAIIEERKKTPKITMSHCEDCGDEIPKKRQAIKGITRCFECQDYYEKQKKRGLL